jgi:hypothetical protein
VLEERCSLPPISEDFYAITLRTRFAHPILWLGVTHCCLGPSTSRRASEIA